MNLYLMRHGIAVPRDAGGIHSDRERPLTQKGIKRMRKAAKGLSALAIPFDQILSSPLTRSRQTAELIAEVLNIKKRLEEIQELAPDRTAQDLLSALTPYRGEKHLLLVGHEPLLSETASFLLSRGKDVKIYLKKGGLCCIEVDDLPAKKAALLHWMLTPKQLRLLAGS